MNIIGKTIVILRLRSPVSILSDSTLVVIEVVIKLVKRQFTIRFGKVNFARVYCSKGFSG